MTSNRIMWAVTLALAPGFAVLSWFYGWGYLHNLAIALPLAYALDFACLRLRGQPLPLFRRNPSPNGGPRGQHGEQAFIIGRHTGAGPESDLTRGGTASDLTRGGTASDLTRGGTASVHARSGTENVHAPRSPSSFDGSIFLGTLILALALPPGMPWHVLLLATFGMVVLARQLYGGLGHNIFNPAMVGYALALVCFPVALATWPPLVDGHTGATALTAFRYREGLTAMEAFAADPAFGQLGGYGWEWANIAFACGGLVAAGLGLIAWRVVLGFLIVLGVFALVFHDGGSSRGAGSPLFHYLSAGTMLAAFFVLTDPVTHPGHPAGQWLFGALAAGITFAIRAWGGYPDGIAFGVLIANAATPFLDALGRGRVGVR